VLEVLYGGIVSDEKLNMHMSLLYSLVICANGTVACLLCLTGYSLPLADATACKSELLAVRCPDVSLLAVSGMLDREGFLEDSWCTCCSSDACVLGWLDAFEDED
jgi:hypothetical protein